MKALKMIAVLLVAAGLFALVYGGFDYPKSAHEAKVGSVEFAVKSEGRTRIPVWAGAGAVVLGTLMLLVPLRRK
jgi:TRAP-type C4-dicarboxylate transport system permease small subunit